MLSELPLFWFELEVVWWFDRFWLVEWCVTWNGDKYIIEMVELGRNSYGYIQE